MLKLLLLRHGKATKFIDDKSDFERHLNKQGTAQINQIGYILHENDYKISKIIASAATRTQETAEIVNFFINTGKIHFDDTLYLVNYDRIMHEIAKQQEGTTLLYVGHNNGISDLASYLTGENLLLSTGQLVEIHFQFDNWSLITKNSGHLFREFIPQTHSF